MLDGLYNHTGQNGDRGVLGIVGGMTDYGEDFHVPQSSYSLPFNSSQTWQSAESFLRDCRKLQGQPSIKVDATT